MEKFALSTDDWNKMSDEKKERINRVFASKISRKPQNLGAFKDINLFDQENF